MNVFLWNARARNGHVEATLNHPFPAQVDQLRATYGGAFVTVVDLVSRSSGLQRVRLGAAQG